MTTHQPDVGVRDHDDQVTDFDRTGRVLVIDPLRRETTTVRVTV